MNEQEYLNYSNSIVSKSIEEQKPPYDNDQYLNYTKLNLSRTSRWLKTQEISSDFKSTLSKIKNKQNWIVITEPWCGDAAHIIPFIILASRENSLINLTFELRDSEPNRIEKYLTNGSKSIPKLIIQDENQKDLAVWGPRPEKCQIVYNDLKNSNATLDEVVTGIQNWYNNDKGVEIQIELLDLIEKIL